MRVVDFGYEYQRILYSFLLISWIVMIWLLLFHLSFL